MDKKNFIPHRKYFNQFAVFQQVAEIKNKEILKLVHTTYRLSYLRDCALAYYLDDRGLNLTTLVINFCI